MARYASLLLLIAIVFAGCGGAQGPQGERGSSGETIWIPSPPSYYSNEITLEAYRTYSPSKWFDGVIKLERETNLLIPNQLNVLYGNAGNHKATLKFDNLTCEYRGGSSSSKPLSKPNNQKEIELGKAYIFEHCLDAQGNLTTLLPHDTVVASTEIVLRVDSGDSTQETYVQVVIKEEQ